MVYIYTYIIIILQKKYIINQYFRDGFWCGGLEFRIIDDANVVGNKTEMFFSGFSSRFFIFV